MHKLITNTADLSDFWLLLKELDYPFYLVTKKAKQPGLNWNKTNAFFHRGIVSLYSSLTGLLEDEAKDELQIKFALVEEHETYYDVESIAGMSKERLVEFIQQCQVHIIKNFGTKANEIEQLKITTKRIRK